MSAVDESTDLFRQEAAELVAALERGLLDLEQAPQSAELINAIFRDMHTVKGSGAMFGFTDLARFVHDFETAFDRLRQGEVQATPALIAVALRACDQITALIADPVSARAASDGLLAELAAALGQKSATAEPVVEGLHLRFYLPVDCMRLGCNPLLLLEELRALDQGVGEVPVRSLVDRVPPLPQLDPQDCWMGWEVTLRGAVSEAAVDEVFLFLRDDMELTVTPLARQMDAQAQDAVVTRQPDPADDPEASVAASGTAAAGNTIRVPTERLDELMDRVGELVIAEARLSSLAYSRRDPALLAVAEDIQRLAAGMRDTTMSIRMVPIGSIFGRFRRLMRDLSETLGKPLNFVTTGAETELDKTVIEMLADPLVHILRNSIDHGLETMEARRTAGKPEAGTIELSATYSGAEVLISVRDDGRGLNAERIRARAIEGGLIAADAQLPESDLLRLIFEPGFSTAKTVTELSGRGVGMDVVKRTISGLRGQIELSSEPGHGTTVTLRLPLTLAIIDGLLIEVGGEHYSLPLAAIEECVELPEQHAVAGSSASLLNIRGAMVPFVRLRDLFETPGAAPEFQKVVIVSSGGARVGLVVDRIVSNSQTVIKQLSQLHAHLKCFSGATILGDGSVALILDVSQLVDYGRAREERARHAGSVFGRPERAVA
ncbi:chemotaxis protein CheA [Phaeovulum sp. W22_SRMD_FR3]|uniref:chemotaxis protein CheA n=1 Tax=Phaeovulum sp. W22_SRMD_FR3 TaxID=3240274 RepID=UPI003F9E3F55